MSIPKTNAMRLLDKAGIRYQMHMYEHDGFTDGVTVAQMLGIPPERVFKTLVALGASRTVYVFVIPVARELDLKAAARAVGEKSMALLPLAELGRVTGYVRGGCSPLGMKKDYRTVIDSACLAQETILVSAGRRGVQIEIAPEDLARAAHAAVAAVTA